MRAPMRPRPALLALVVAAALAGACFDRAVAETSPYERPKPRPAVFVRDSDDSDSASPQQVRRDEARPTGLDGGLFVSAVVPPIFASPLFLVLAFVW